MDKPTKDLYEPHLESLLSATRRGQMFCIYVARSGADRPIKRLCCKISAGGVEFDKSDSVAPHKVGFFEKLHVVTFDIASSENIEHGG